MGSVPKRRNKVQKIAQTYRFVGRLAEADGRGHSTCTAGKEGRGREPIGAHGRRHGPHQPVRMAHGDRRQRVLLLEAGVRNRNPGPGVCVDQICRVDRRVVRQINLNCVCFYFYLIYFIAEVGEGEGSSI